MKYGFVGTEAEWNDAVNLNRIAAENAFTEADKARIAAIATRFNFIRYLSVI